MLKSVHCLTCSVAYCCCCCFRQELIAAGEIADRIYLIARGEVEIVQGHVSGHEPLISGVEVELGADAADADMWDSTQVSDISKSPGEES
jgi:hypothetical protein